MTLERGSEMRKMTPSTAEWRRSSTMTCLSFSPSTFTTCDFELSGKCLPIPLSGLVIQVIKEAKWKVTAVEFSIWSLEGEAIGKYRLKSADECTKRMDPAYRPSFTDEMLRRDSEITLKQEIAWASHLSLQACLSCAQGINPKH
ncbi:hypothetical protein HAX54_005968 [Datura stramonium]|uniref:Uncharacterized protein n=1 Tax=Datura stramonium TaxID=4076 RepID=A0ABS8RHR2_DATST|nr:hypothetical protein [Datura stramonium]